MSGKEEMNKRIHITLHDVSPMHEKTIKRIHTDLSELGVTGYSMMVVPDFWNKWPLEDHPEFCGWLRELSDSGIEMILHGYSHIDCTEKHGITDRIRAALFTRGEGEFLGLDSQEAFELLLKGRKALQQTLALDITGFTAPAWLYSRGTMEALRKTGFSYAESRWRTWNPVTGKTVLRVPVMNFAGGSSLKRVLAELWVCSSRILLHGMKTVRFALHPSDFSDSVTREKVLKHLGLLLNERTPVLGHTLSGACPQTHAYIQSNIWRHALSGACPAIEQEKGNVSRIR